MTHRAAPAPLEDASVVVIEFGDHPVVGKQRARKPRSEDHRERLARRDPAGPLNL